jgi:uncharacterized protein (DUF305 family)
MKYLAYSLAIVALVIGIGIGYTLTPQYAQGEAGMMQTSFGRADRFVDQRYVNTMIAHHRAAMLMAEQVRNTSQRQEIKALATDILSNEPKLIDELYAWKKVWYKDSAKVADPKVPAFGEFDETYDLRFLNALIEHHIDGIAMTKDILVKSSRSEILKNADAVQTFLRTTLVTLQGWREQWYQVK